MGAIPTGFADNVSTVVTSVGSTVSSLASTIVNTFPLNLFVVLGILGLATGLIMKFKR